MRGKWALFGGIAVFLAAAAGALSLWKSTPVPKPPPPAPVVVQPGVGPGGEVNIAGTVEAREVVGVQAPSGGVIAEYLVVVGEEVFESQLLARIQNVTLEAEKEKAKMEADRAQERINNLESQQLAARLESTRARAEVARLQEDYGRNERLYQREIMLNNQGATPRLKFEKSKSDFENSKLEFDSASGRLKVAEARITELTREIESAKKLAEDKASNLEEAESNLQSTQIHAPVDGVVVARKGEAGAEIQKGEDDVFRIATDLGQLQVVIKPDPAILAKLQPGQPALVILAENASELINAEINRIENGQAIVFFGSPDPSIKPGVSAQVKLKLP